MDNSNNNNNTSTSSTKRRDRFRSRDASAKLNNGRNNAKNVEVKKLFEKNKGHVPLKNQIRSIERLLKKDLPEEIKINQERKLSELKKLLDEHQNLEIERKMAIRYRKVKFFERRKIERRMRRIEKQLRNVSENESQTESSHLDLISNLNDQFAQLKEDLEYIQFFPKTEPYVSLFMGQNDPRVETKRDEMRKKIKENILSAQAQGQELEETGSEDDGMLDISEDEFFMAKSSGDEAHADDELGDDTSLDNNAESAPLSDHRSHPQQRLAAANHLRQHRLTNPNEYRRTSDAGSVRQTPNLHPRFGRPPLPRRGMNHAQNHTHLVEKRRERRKEGEEEEEEDKEETDRNSGSRNIMPPPGITGGRSSTSQSLSRQERDAEVAESATAGAISVGGSSSSQVEDANEKKTKKRKRMRPKKKRNIAT